MTIELNSITSGYSTGLINDNFQSLEDYINDKLLNRDGVEVGEVNQMELNLDMNSHFVYNLPEPVLEHQAARLQDVQNAVAGGAANLITFTPYGFITSENVQGAIQELADSAAQDPNTFEVDTETGTQTLQDALNDRATKTDIAGFASTQETLLTVNIPTDYATLQEAIDDLSTLVVKQGAVIDIVIETGHSPASGVLVENGEYGHFRISSADATVTLDPTFPFNDVIKGVNAKMPVLNCLIDANGLGASGYYALENSSGYVTAGNGVINAGRHGLIANYASVVFANDTVWTGASQSSLAWAGILSWGSRISAQGADVSNSLYYGAQAAAAGVLSFRDGVANNTGRYGIRATNSGHIDARRVEASGNAVYGIFARDASFINAKGSIANNNTNANVYATRGSVIDFGDEASAVGPSSCDGGGSIAQIFADQGALVHCGAVELSNGTNNGIECNTEGKVTANVLSLSSYSAHGLVTGTGGTIHADNSTINGAGSSGNVVRCISGKVNIRNTAVTNPATSEVIRLTEGAVVNASAGTTVGGSALATSDTNLDTFNGFDSTSPNRGILWA